MFFCAWTGRCEKMNPKQRFVTIKSNGVHNDRSIIFGAKLSKFGCQFGFLHIIQERSFVARAKAPKVRNTPFRVHRSGFSLPWVASQNPQKPWIRRVFVCVIWWSHFWWLSVMWMGSYVGDNDPTPAMGCNLEPWGAAVCIGLHLCKKEQHDENRTQNLDNRKNSVATKSDRKWSMVWRKVCGFSHSKLGKQHLPNQWRRRSSKQSLTHDCLTPPRSYWCLVGAKVMIVNS